MLTYKNQYICFVNVCLTLILQAISTKCQKLGPCNKTQKYMHEFLMNNVFKIFMHNEWFFQGGDIELELFLVDLQGTVGQNLEKGPNQALFYLVNCYRQKLFGLAQCAKNDFRIILELSIAEHGLLKPQKSYVKRFNSWKSGLK